MHDDRTQSSSKLTSFQIQETMRAVLKDRNPVTVEVNTAKKGEPPDLDELTIKPTAPIRVVAAELVGRGNYQSGKAAAGMASLSSATGTSRTTVRRAILWTEARGYATRAGTGRHGAALYQIHPTAPAYESTDSDNTPAQIGTTGVPIQEPVAVQSVQPAPQIGTETGQIGTPPIPVPSVPRNRLLPPTNTNPCSKGKAPEPTLSAVTETAVVGEGGRGVEAAAETAWGTLAQRIEHAYAEAFGPGRKGDMPQAMSNKFRREAQQAGENTGLGRLTTVDGWRDARAWFDHQREFAKPRPWKVWCFQAVVDGYLTTAKEPEKVVWDSADEHWAQEHANKPTACEWLQRVREQKPELSELPDAAEALRRPAAVLAYTDYLTQQQTQRAAKIQAEREAARASDEQAKVEREAELAAQTARVEQARDDYWQSLDDTARKQAQDRVRKKRPEWTSAEVTERAKLIAHVMREPPQLHVTRSGAGRAIPAEPNAPAAAPPALHLQGA